MKRFGPALFALSCLIANGGSAETVNLVYSNAWNSNDTQTGLVAEEWIRRIEEATEGRVDIRHISGGALLDAEGTLEGIRKQVADIGAVSVNYHIGELPISAALAGALNIEYGNKLDLMGITAVTQQLYEEFPEFPEEYERLGVKPPALGAGRAVHHYRHGGHRDAGRL
jgi:TRAP-type C4-dicarboxylate transport system substrate-binding protein